jgi:hypothetical protein
LIHRFLLLECQGSKHSDYQQYFLIRKMECRSHHLSSRHAVRPFTENQSMVQIAPDFKAELKDRDTTAHNSPRLARARHLMDDAMGKIVATWAILVASPGFPVNKSYQSAGRRGRVSCRTGWRAGAVGFDHGSEVRYWPFNLAFPFDANRLVIAAWVPAAISNSL